MRRRKQAYRKEWVPLEQRERFVDAWVEAFALFRGRYESGHMQAAEFCAAVIDRAWRDLFPTSWSNGRRSLQEDSSKGSSDFFEAFLKTRYRGLPEAVPHSLAAWNEGLYPLKLFFHSLSVTEVLELQSRGQRCVSLLLTPADILNFEHEGRDFLSFLIHDLVHADHLMKEPLGYCRQIQFSKWMWGFWQNCNRSEFNSTQQERFEYIAADMNSHFVHLLKTLKALIDEVGSSEVKSNLFSSLPGSSATFQKCFNQLNGPLESGLLHFKLLDSWDLIELPLVGPVSNFQSTLES